MPIHTDPSTGKLQWEPLLPPNPKGVIVARVVYVCVSTKRSMGGGATDFLLHEIPLARRRLQMVGETLTIESEWAHGLPRAHAWDMNDVRREMDRLKGKYGDVVHGESRHDILAQVYGPAGRDLPQALRKIGDAYQRFLDTHDGEDPTSAHEWETLAQLADAASMELDPLPALETETTVPVDPGAGGGDPEAGIRADVLEALMERGISPGRAREVAVLAKDGAPTLEALIVVFKGNVEKAKTARAAIESVRK